MMQNIRIIILSILTIITSLFTHESRAEGIGEWKLFTSYSEIESIIPAGKIIYVKASGALYKYNVNDNSVDEITKQEGLSDIRISKVAWSSAAKALVIVYENSNIDILYQDGTVVNISDLYNKQMTGGKTVNNIFISGKFAYLSAEFGILKIDVSEGYVCDNYNIGKNIIDFTLNGNDAYALTENSIITAKLSDNIVDKSVWKNYLSVNNTGLSKFQCTNGKLLVCMQNNICSIDLSTKEVTPIIEKGFTWTLSLSDRIIFGYTDYFAELYGNNELQYHWGLDFPCTQMVYDYTNKCYWGNNSSGMLTKYALDGHSVTATSLGVMPDGPIVNDNYHMAFSDGKLYVTSGMWSNSLGQYSKHGHVMCFKDDKWSDLENGDNVTAACGRFNDINSVAIDPRDSEHVYVANFNGLFEFKNGKFVKYYGQNDGMVTYDENPAKPYHVICTTLCFDAANNLWVLNSYTKSPLFCITASGELKHLTAVEKSDKSFFYDCEGILAEGNNVWWGNDRTNYVGLYRYNIVENKLYSLHEFYNQDNSLLKISAIMTTAKDLDGNIWIGTNAGPFYIKPADVSNFGLTQHKVPRNDGTNLADYLLKDVYVLKIFVDPANRKWIGTLNDGIYLISSDCNTQIAHYTKENSPLPSNMIFDMVLDPKTGRLFVSTNKGLCSFMSDATESNESLDDNNVYAYPNPVSPDYTGLITVVGLKRDCNVSIVSVSGELVNKGTSNGGTYTWDGRNQDGDCVASGVYMVLASSSDANETAVCKIAIVR